MTTKTTMVLTTIKLTKSEEALYYYNTSRHAKGHVLILVVMQLYEYKSESNGMTFVSLFVVLTVLVEQLKELTGSLRRSDSVVALQVKLVECINLSPLLTQLGQSSS